MKKMLVCVLAGVFVVAGALPVLAQDEAATPAAAASRGEEAAREVTQAELAQLLVKLLGLSRHLPPSPSTFECFAVLVENGISPADGWKADAKLTRGDLARVIVQAMKRQNEVKNPEDPVSWLEFLRAEGISMESVGEATAELKPLAEPIAPNVARATTLAMEKRHKYNPVDEVNYGADLGMLVRTLTQLAQPEKPVKRPRPVTPD